MIFLLVLSDLGEKTSKTAMRSSDLQYKICISECYVLKVSTWLSRNFHRAFGQEVNKVMVIYFESFVKVK